MRRRILTAIVGVTTLATVVLTIPLAIVSSIRARDDAVHELDLIAERVASDISVDSIGGGDGIELPLVEDVLVVGVYDPNGVRVAGDGPERADDVVDRTDLLTQNEETDEFLVLARPLVVNERSLGVVRVAEPLTEIEAAVRHDLMLLLAFDAAAVAVAAAAGWFLAARLVRPLSAIRDDAVRLGHGDFAIDPRHCGVGELDATSDALAETAERLDATLRREREFSANASHQLRTPLTALRLAIEGELVSPRPDGREVLEDSLGEIDRLENTITTLLDAARGRSIRRVPLDVTGWMAALHGRWATRGDAAGRSMTFDAGAAGTSVQVSRDVLDEICDVLMSNALDHGEGAIDVAAHLDASNLVVTVTDEGRLDRDPARLFVRHDPNAAGSGVGLALARSLAESEGGRLVVESSEPTSFRMILPDLVGVVSAP